MSHFKIYLKKDFGSTVLPNFHLSNANPSYSPQNHHAGDTPQTLHLSFPVLCVVFSTCWALQGNVWLPPRLWWEQCVPGLAWVTMSWMKWWAVILKPVPLSGKAMLNCWASTVGTQALGTKFQVDANTAPSLEKSWKVNCYRNVAPRNWWALTTPTELLREWLLSLWGHSP